MLITIETQAPNRLVAHAMAARLWSLVPDFPRGHTITKFPHLIPRRTPNLGQAISSLAPSFAVVMISALALSGRADQVLAADECGVVLAGGTIVCDGDGTPATDVNPYATGISYVIDGVSLSVNGAATMINSGANPGVEVVATTADIFINTASTLTITTDVGGGGASLEGIVAHHTGGNGVINITSASDITTTGNTVLSRTVNGGRGAHAIYAFQQAIGDVVINAIGGTIRTSGANSTGIASNHTSAGNITINSAADIITTGFNGGGIYARNLTPNPSDVTVNMTAGSIATSGAAADGVAVNSANGSATANLNNSRIFVSGDFAEGILTFAGGAGFAGDTNVNLVSSDVTMTGLLSTGLLINTSGDSGGVNINSVGGRISTAGDNTFAAFPGFSGAILARSFTAINPDNIVINTQDTFISTTGLFAHGITSIHEGTGNIVTRVIGGQVTTAGENSDGIAAIHNGTGSVNITIGASVSGGFAEGDGLSVDAVTGGGTADVLPGGELGALSDSAIRDTDGALAINNSGTVRGFISLGGGNDVFTNLSSNSFNVRHFADTDGDGIRDTENVAVNDFGAGVDTFTNAATGTVRLLTVEDMSGLSVSTDDDTPPIAFNATGVAQYFPAGSAALSNTRAGIEQGHFVNLETFTNAGVITMQDGETGGTGPVAGDVLVITGGATAGTSGGGVFRSAGGSLRIDTVLNDGVIDTTDVLVVDGTVVAGGPTQVFVANAGGRGAATDVNGNGRFDEGEGILVVEVLDAGNSDANAFSLGAPVIAGAYSYSLFNGPVGGEWYLASQFSPATAVYEVYPAALLALTSSVSTLQQRVGNRHWGTAASRPVSTEDYTHAPMKLGAGSPADPSAFGDAMDENKPAIWARVEASRSHFEPESSTADTSHSINLTKLQSGLDGVIYEGADGRLIGGLVVQYNSARTSVSSFFGDGEIHTTGFGVGATLSWYGQDGLYVDAQAYANRFDSDLSSDTLGSLIESNDGFGHALSLELGQRFMASANWTLTPQAQLVYSRARFESFADTFTTFVTQDDADSLRGRLGLSVDHEQFWLAQDGSTNRSHVYAIANIRHDFKNETQVDVSGVTFENDKDDWSGEIGLGGTLNWADDAYSVYGEANTATSLENFGDSYRYAGTIGFRVKW